MLSLDFICLYPEAVREALQRRRETYNIDEILHLAEQRRGLTTRNEDLYSSLKQLKGQVSKADEQKRVTLNQRIKATERDIRRVEMYICDVETQLQLQLLNLPNLPHQSVQEGDNDSNDVELRRWGEPVPFHFTPSPHWEIGKRLDIIDTESGTKITGSRFVTLKGLGARLERALISFMLDVHTREHSYTEIMPPQLVKPVVMQSAGQLPKFENQAYLCSSDTLYLNPTAIVPLVGLHSDTILTRDKLPLCYAAWATAFRREAGSPALQPRGLLRPHQFNTVELFQMTTPEESYNALEQMLLHAEAILQRLELPYRVVMLCTGKLPVAAAKTYELEVWLPSMNSYVGVSSVSNCETFQARRANIKYRPTNGARSEYVHTLNASGLTVGRTMAAILEIYQQADGSVVIPKVLRPYMGFSLLASAQH
ncbi:MAG: serine--tRNA ligase [Chloroflexi bacterium]|nr:MAG: serine--tRNA ligase [Chloroflexota bacterium]